MLFEDDLQNETKIQGWVLVFFFFLDDKQRSNNN